MTLSDPVIFISPLLMATDAFLFFQRNMPDNITFRKTITCHQPPPAFVVPTANYSVVLSKLYSSSKKGS